MLTYDDALNMNYYKKTDFTGWMGGMRFVLGKEPEADEFHAWVWPGPYIFDKTDDSKKTDAKFPFTDEGKKAAVDWINEQYESRKAEWPDKKMSTEWM
ncbi:MAG: GNAT family acetyltransferase [Agathobacter sp.]|uniref:GNAT family acetyltransferase n=1 Tax=Agathobacter sp. TaxID=2021311 RepID=UPI002584B814|nr:GNAT family acetyltransferase [Agathobacter sp.]MCR5678517.1 GNAT family acetyltransferase [Agathobacter sp.]